MQRVSSRKQLFQLSHLPLDVYRQKGHFGNNLSVLPLPLCNSFFFFVNKTTKVLFLFCGGREGGAIHRTPEYIHPCIVKADGRRDDALDHNLFE